MKLNAFKVYLIAALLCVGVGVAGCSTTVHQGEVLEQKSEPTTSPVPSTESSQDAVMDGVSAPLMRLKKQQQEHESDDMERLD